jgi:hypothetical protein
VDGEAHERIGTVNCRQVLLVPADLFSKLMARWATLGGVSDSAISARVDLAQSARCSKAITSAAHGGLSLPSVS